MHVAIAFEFATLNGGERSMLCALDHLRRSDVEVTALAPPAGRLAEALRGRSIRLIPFEVRAANGTRVSRREAVARLRDAVDAVRPDLLHANSLAMGRLTGALAAETDLPSIAHLRDILKLSRAACADLNRNRLLLAVSHATRQFHVAGGLDGEKVRVLYNGVDCARFSPRPRTGWLRRELGLPAKSFLAATIGQIALRKGQDVLAAAAALLATQLPNLHFLLVGERHSQKRESVDFEREVLDRFARARLYSRLHVLGDRSDVAELLNEVDLVVHPAKQEPLGRVLLEAAAAGAPIVATRVGGTEEILEDGHSARLVRPRDPGALAESIRKLYRSRANRWRLAANARLAAEQRFSAQSAAAGLLAVWREVLGRPD